MARRCLTIFLKFFIYIAPFVTCDGVLAALPKGTIDFPPPSRVSIRGCSHRKVANVIKEKMAKLLGDFLKIV